MTQGLGTGAFKDSLVAAQLALAADVASHSLSVAAETQR